MPLIHSHGGIIMSAKIRNIQPRAVVDSVAVHFPLFSYYGRPKVTAGNGVRFWRYFDNWYTTFELSRYNSYGTYTPYLPKTPHSSQNNINPPFYRSVRSATNRIYHGYMDVILSHDKADFYQFLSSGDYTCAPKITRIDIAFDLPSRIVPTPADLLRYIKRGRGSGSRYLKAASAQRLYVYDKKRDSWQLVQQRPNGPTQVTEIEPYFMDSPEQLERALLKNEITIYIGTRNGEIKIYSKGGGVRYELSARKTILRKMMRDRRLCVLRNPLVLQTLFQNAAQRIGEIFAHSCLRSIFLRSVKEAIRNFWHGFSGKSAEYGMLPVISPYNNVVVIYAIIPQEQERPPPIALMASRIRKQQMPILGRCLLLSCAYYMLRNRNK